MQNHWPLLVAAIMISIAVALGLWKRDLVVESAGRHAPAAATGIAQAPVQDVPQQAQPVPLQAEKADTQKQAAAAPAPLPLPNVVAPPPTALPPQTPQVAVAPTTPIPPVQTVPPPVSPPQPKFSLPSAQPPAGVVANPAAAPKAVAPAAGAPGDVLGSLRAKLETMLGLTASDLAAGGYAYQLDGARIEVQGLPNWSVVIWNINPNKEQPEVETENFKKLYQAAAAELGFDPNQKGVTLGSGSTSLQTTSKLGNLTVVRDPAKGNSATIHPNQRRIPAPPPAPPPANATAAPAQTQP